jgi:hypothetical protein
MMIIIKIILVITIEKTSMIIMRVIMAYEKIIF